jgi:hypothetical protein
MFLYTIESLSCFSIFLALSVLVCCCFINLFISLRRNILRNVNCDSRRGGGLAKDMLVGVAEYALDVAGTCILVVVLDAALLVVDERVENGLAAHKSGIKETVHLRLI